MNDFLRDLKKLANMSESEMSKESNDSFENMTDNQKIGATTATILGSVGHIRQIIAGKETLDSKDLKNLGIAADNIQDAMTKCAEAFDVDMEHVMRTIFLADIAMDVLQGKED